MYMIHTHHWMQECIIINFGLDNKEYFIYLFRVIKMSFSKINKKGRVSCLDGMVEPKAHLYVKTNDSCNLISILAY